MRDIKKRGGCNSSSSDLLIHEVEDIKERYKVRKSQGTITTDDLKEIKKLLMLLKTK